MEIIVIINSLQPQISYRPWKSESNDRTLEAIASGVGIVSSRHVCYTARYLNLQAETIIRESMSTLLLELDPPNDKEVLETIDVGILKSSGSLLPASPFNLMAWG
jgi:hypothetical protein